MNFKIGEIYKDREGGDYKFIAFVPEASEYSQAIFLDLKDLDMSWRYPDGTVHPNSFSNGDILPPEMKTVKLYQALYHNTFGGYSLTDGLYETKPEHTIRLVTEWPAVVVEVEE